MLYKCTEPSRASIHKRQTFVKYPRCWNAGKQTPCSLQVQVLVVKLKTLHSVWFILGHPHSVHYYGTFYLMHA